MVCIMHVGVSLHLFQNQIMALAATSEAGVLQDFLTRDPNLFKDALTFRCVLLILLLGKKTERGKKHYLYM